MSNAVPINGFHTVGMIKDTAAVSLPSAALTDAVNVRFKNGSVEKVSGSLEVVANSDLNPLLNDGEVTYLAVWKNPNVSLLFGNGNGLEFSGSGIPVRIRVEGVAS